MVDSLKQESDSLKQKALDLQAKEQGFDSWQEFKKLQKSFFALREDATEKTLRVVFLWADKKEKEIIKRTGYSFEEDNAALGQLQEIKKQLEGV